MFWRGGTAGGLLWREALSQQGAIYFILNSPPTLTRHCLSLPRASASWPHHAHNCSDPVFSCRGTPYLPNGGSHPGVATAASAAAVDRVGDQNEILPAAAASRQTPSPPQQKQQQQQPRPVSGSQRYVTQMQEELNKVSQGMQPTASLAAWVPKRCRTVSFTCCPSRTCVGCSQPL